MSRIGSAGIVAALALGALALALAGCGAGGGSSGKSSGSFGGGATGGSTSGTSGGSGTGSTTTGGGTGGTTTGGGTGSSASGPRITFSVPANQAPAAPTNGVVALVFSEAMNVSTLTTATLGLSDAQGNAVPAAVDYNAALQVATISPTQLLAAGAGYSVSVAPSVAAASGATVGAVPAIAFTTGPGQAQGPIAFAGIASASLAGTTATISWTAASSPDYASSELYYTVHAGATAQTIDFNHFVAIAGFGATQAQVASVAAGTTYFAVRAWDLAGNGESNARWASVTTAGSTPAPAAHAIQTVWMIVMENHNWSDIKTSSSATYIQSLLATSAHCESYWNPTNLHPSEPNYIWLEAGDNFGFTTDDDPNPVTHHISSTRHLATLLDGAGLTWRAYEENMVAGTCPVASSGLYAAKHNPFVFFDDTSGGVKATNAYCAAHNVPYTAAGLQADLNAGNAAAYNFITPNLCDDSHNSTGCGSGDSILHGDRFLASVIPIIQASAAYQAGGAIFITWDECEVAIGAPDVPIGLIVISPFAKPGYASTQRHDHSSTLKSLQEIFGVTPLLGHAADAGTQDLRELFTQFP
jgi:hypothetical protein